jgi:maltodextrin utilization protein YvdJ
MKVPVGNQALGFLFLGILWMVPVTIHFFEENFTFSLKKDCFLLEMT